MFNKERWTLPMQIAAGLLLCELLRQVAMFALRALGKG